MKPVEANVIPILRAEMSSDVAVASRAFVKIETQLESAQARRKVHLEEMLDNAASGHGRFTDKELIIAGEELAIASATLMMWRAHRDQ